MSDELGRAELGLGADLAPLDADLKRAEARVAASVAVMQKMLDSLHAEVDFKAKALEAAAARMASAGVPGPASSSTSTVVGGRNEIWGVRGPEHPGSLQNPLVMVQAAGKYFPMGSYAAAVGDSNQTDAQGAQNTEQSGLATSAQIAALTAAIQDLANNATPGSRMAAAGAAGLGEPNSAARTQAVLSDQDSQALRDMAAAMARMEARQSGHSVFVDHSTGAQRTIIAGPTGSSGRTIISGPPGENTVRLDGGQYAGLISAILQGRGGGGGGYLLGGDSNITKRVDVFYHSSREGGGASSASLASLLGFGTAAGIAGFAGVGSIGSFAGLGFEHLLTTLLGIGGSAAGALGGAGLLGLGSLGKIGVGAGSDIAATLATAQAVKGLNTAYENLDNAVTTYGKNSKQAQQAQQQLNGTLAQLNSDFGPKAAKAINGVSLAWQGMTDNFSHSIAPAMVESTKIFQDAITTADKFIPLVGQAALRNLTIVNQGLHPLFLWLQGPQGIQIFNDLENAFARDLPTAIHAFNQAIEFILRIMDIASAHTGGFIRSLDHLFTRLNNLDNATLGRGVNRFIGDFRLWEHFVKLLVDDIYLLFHQDVGTGNSIIGALTGMLQKLHDYETSARGSAQIQNIFMVHKTEILDLIDVFGRLSSIFGHIYLAVAPALVTVMNDMVLPALKAVADVVAFLAGKSQVLATLMGIALIVGKMGGAGAVGKVFGGGLGFLMGRGAASAAGGAAAGAAEGVGGATVATGLPGLIESGGLAAGGGLEALGLGGAASAVVGGAGALSAALPIIIPGIAAAVGAYFVGHDLLGIGKTTPISVTPGNIASGGVRANIPFTGSNPLGGPGAPGVAGVSGQTLNIQSLGHFANYSTQQLQDLIKAMKEANGLQLNGVSVPKDQLLQLAEAALKARQQWNRTFNEAWEAVNTFYRNTSRTLPALYDDFNSNMRLIAHTMGLNSDQGRKLVADNINKMVAAVDAGMQSGKIVARKGIQAINQTLDTGLQDGAITWNQAWKTRFGVVTQMYLQNKLDTKTYLSDLRQLNSQGIKHIKDDTQGTYKAMFANLKSQYDDGLITQGQFNSQVNNLNTSLNSSEKTQMSQFSGQIANAFAQATGAGALGLQDLWKSVNSMLKLLGAPPLSALQVAVMNSSSLQQGTFALPHGAGTNVGAGIQGHATGAKVSSPMYMVGEEHQTEYVLATNPAYRDRNIPLWLQAGHDLGIPGFAQGGVSAPTVHGHGVFADIVNGMLSKSTSAANHKLGMFNAAAAGTGAPGSSHFVSVPGNVVAWLLAAMAIDNVSGPLWLPMLERQTSRESGGNPRAINLWDSNAQAGHPSKGLLQMIDGTFAQYQAPGHPNIWNPIDNAAAAIRYMIARYGGGNANAAVQTMWARGGGGYARGGRIPGFKTGGTPYRAGGALGGAFGLTPLGMIGSALLGQGAQNLSGTDYITASINAINSIIGPDGSVNKTSDLMSFWQGMWGLDSTVSGIMSGGPTAAIITDPTTGAQSIDQASVNTAIARLSQEVGWESSIVGDERRALTLSQALPPKIRTQIKQRQEKVAAIKRRIVENLKKIAEFRKRITQVQKQINTERGKKHPNWHAISTWQNQIIGFRGQITNLESDNFTLGGNKTVVGTGGQIGNLTGEIHALQGELQTVSGYPDQIGGAGGSGLGGQLGPAQITLAQLSQELSSLSPGALQAALAQAQANGQSGGANQSALVSLLEQQNQTLAQQLAVSQAQYAVFSGPTYGLMGAGLPKFGGSFANGGLVPGRLGEPRLILAHGGETVTPAGGGDLHLHAHGSAQGLVDLIDFRIEKAGRQQALTARRQLPGRPGALLPG